MMTVAMRGTIDADGTFRLSVPVGLPAGPAEVLFVVQPSERPLNTEDLVARLLTSAPSGLFTRTPESEALDFDAARREINEAWQTKLTAGL